MTRREAREAVFSLIYEYEFQRDLEPDTVFAVSTENRDIPAEEDEYIRTAFFGVCDHVAEVDARIAAHSGTWKPGRMSRITRTILRLAVYELAYMPEIPHNVTINEAIELAKRYEDDRAPAFINGILNAVAKQLDAEEAEMQ